MKTAEEWRIEIKDNDCLSYGGSIDRTVKQIQLDAMKEGMRRAETLVQEEHNSFVNRDCNLGFKTARDRMSKSILSAAEQLTLKDLCPEPTKNL